MKWVIREWLRDDIKRDAVPDTKMIDFQGFADVAGVTEETVKWWASRRYKEKFPKPVATGWLNRPVTYPKNIYLLSDVNDFLKSVSKERDAVAKRRERIKGMREQAAELQAQIEKLTNQAEDLNARADALESA
jgi:hypothetical protein